MKTQIIESVSDKLLIEMDGIQSLDGVSHIKNFGVFYDVLSSVYSIQKCCLFIFVERSDSILLAIDGSKVL